MILLKVLFNKLSGLFWRLVISICLLFSISRVGLTSPPHFDAIHLKNGEYLPPRNAPFFSQKLIYRRVSKEIEILNIFVPTGYHVMLVCRSSKTCTGTDSNFQEIQVKPLGPEHYEFYNISSNTSSVFRLKYKNGK